MKESQIQNKIIKYLESIGAYVVKTIQTNKSGCPDLLVCLNGKFIGIEVKRPGEKLEPLQSFHLEKIDYSGGLSMVARSLDDVKHFLSTIEVIKIDNRLSRSKRICSKKL